MKKDVAMNVGMSMVMIGIMTFIMVSLVLGESGVPIDLKSNIIGNVMTAIISGGISALMSTIIVLKKFRRNK
jgi:Kef-type K+ transport system membrane component KefB